MVSHSRMARCVVNLLVCALAAVPLLAQDTVPEDVVDDFFRAYLSDVGAQPEPIRREPAAYGEFLTDAFIAEMNALAASAGEAGYDADPFLCAQAVPSGFTTTPVGGDEQSATVIVHLTFGDNPTPHDLTVTLLAQDGWKIDDIACGETITARGVVADFYAWYTAYTRPDSAGTVRNPLVDGAYRSYPFLTAELVAELDAQAGRSRMADPFLCAQDVPDAVTAYALSEAGDRAEVLVQTLFSGVRSSLLAKLVNRDGQWQMELIQCDAGPEVMTRHFYNQYSTMMRYDIEHGIERVPLADWGYGLTANLDPDLFEALLSTFTSAEPRLADPVLCAQDLPDHVTTELVSADKQIAEVHVSGTYPQSAEAFATIPLARVTLHRAGAEWQLAGIICD